MAANVLIDTKEFHVAHAKVKWIENEDSFCVAVENGSKRLMNWSFRNNSFGETLSFYWFEYLSRTMVQQNMLGLSPVPKELLGYSTKTVCSILSNTMMN